MAGISFIAVETVYYGETLNLSHCPSNNRETSAFISTQPLLKPVQRRDLTGSQILRLYRSNYLHMIRVREDECIFNFICGVHRRLTYKRLEDLNLAWRETDDG